MASANPRKQSSRSCPVAAATKPSSSTASKTEAEPQEENSIAVVATTTAADPQESEQRGVKYNNEQLYILLLEAVALKATNAGWGTGQKCTEVYKRMLAACEKHLEWGNLKGLVQPQNLGKKLKTIIVEGHIETRVKPDTGHPIDIEKLQALAATLRKGQEEVKGKTAEEKHESEWHDVLGKLAQQWGIWAACGGDGARCRQANIAIQLMQKMKTGQRNEQGEFIIHPAAAWVFEGEGAIGHPLHMHLTQEQIPFVPDTPPAKMRARALAADADSPPSTPTALIRELLGSSTESSFCVGDPACKCRFTRQELKEEGVSLTQNCPACGHSRAQHP